MARRFMTNYKIPDLSKPSIVLTREQIHPALVYAIMLRNVVQYIGKAKRGRGLSRPIHDTINGLQATYPDFDYDELRAYFVESGDEDQIETLLIQLHSPRFNIQNKIKSKTPDMRSHLGF
jgi:hypothetical protein